MAVLCSPFGPKPQFELSSGIPAVGNKLFFYVAGSVNTKQNTYTSSTGGVANTNPIILDSLGQPTGVEIWFTAGQTYKVVYAPSTDTDPPSSPIWTIDNLAGINDTTGSQDEWKAGPAPTFVSTTSFTLVGDQTTTFQPSRRVKTTNSGGTIFSTILTSAFGVVTTVVVANDSGVLDSGLSAVSYSLISAANTSIDADMVNRKGAAVVSAATTNIWGIAGNSLHVTGNTGPITSFGTAPYAGAWRIITFDSNPTITQNATTLQCPGAQSVAVQAGDKALVLADTTANMILFFFQRVGQPATTLGVIASGRNIAARTNSGTPNTKLDITADEIQLEDANGNTFVAKTTSLTIDFGVVGANGIDAGTQVLNSWYYGWVIAKPDGTVAGLGSLSSTAPTLPSGYTFKALATAARSDGSVHFLKYRQFGNTAHYEASQNALTSAGVNTGETTVSVSTFVPPNAQEMILNHSGSASANGGGALSATNFIRYISGSNRNSVVVKTSGASQSSSWGFEVAVPNVSQQIFTIWDNNTNFAANSVVIDVIGFKLPMGGE